MASDSDKKSHFQIFLSFVSFNLVFNIALSVQGIIILKLVSPVIAGIWLGLQLIQNYGIQLHFGILNGMARQIPFYFGRGLQDMASRVESVSRFSIFMLSIFYLVLAFVFMASGIVKDEWNVPICTMFIITMLRLNLEFHIGLFKATQQFNKATIIIGFEVLLMCLALPLVYFFQLEGLLLRSFICNLSIS